MKAKTPILKHAVPVLWRGLAITGRTPTFKPSLRQANREGRKTETRRMVSPQPKHVQGQIGMGPQYAPIPYSGWTFEESLFSDLPDYAYPPDPYFALKQLASRVADTYPANVGDIRVMPEPLINRDGFAYYADTAEPCTSLITGQPLKWRWKTNLLTSQFMPVEAGRFVVEYLEIRAERLHDITPESAIAEGIEPITGRGDKPGWKNYADPHGAYTDPISSYRSLWEMINAKRGFPWASNPWVWVIKYTDISSGRGGTPLPTAPEGREAAPRVPSNPEEAKP